ncbi:MULTISPECIES: DNA polymerase III subunit gamma/tau [Microbacterium]|uniref:DNA polymerase III subunit gamma/tau n=1 Tax=Microbacterium TaxID=33882 RepID=UPI003BA10330
MPSRDDDALRWEGDDDPTLDARSETAAEPGEKAAPDAPGEKDDPSVLPAGWRAVGKGRDAVTTADAGDEAAPLGNVALVSLGVIGGVYLLWTIGWFLGATRLRERIEQSTNAVADFMFQGSMWLAIASPLLWFAVTWLGTRRAPLWRRFAWLAAGIVLLVPWPFVMVGVVGQ